MSAKQKQPNAAQVSSTLRRAGHIKAGEYKAWGRSREGFIVAWQRVNGTVSVFYSQASRRPADAAPLVEAYAKALVEAGYNAKIIQGHDGAARSIDVLRWES